MTVLVTGAAGSIGSEVCRQVQGPLIALDQAETPLFHLGRELPHAKCVVADVCDEDAMLAAVEEHRPQLIVHAAAYKHVSMCEDNVRSAVLNNVFGTLSVAKAASRFSVKRFVLVSTDKAVNPTSVMGCTKRVAEMVVHSHFKGRPWTKAKVVRFGNVMGSAGSVIPIFERQVAEGGPVTVTHPDVTRYMMTIPAAARLILSAARLPGDLFVLDMGGAVSILDLAKRMIGDKDIRIEFTGLKPGEKMHEELHLGDERLEPAGEGILRARVRATRNIELALRRLRLAQGESITQLLSTLVPEARLKETACPAAAS